MDNKNLHDKFRLQFTNVHALTVLTVSLLEIVGYVILILSGLETFSLSNAYLWYGVVFPIGVNLITHLAARFIIYRSKISRRGKNKTIVGAALITSLVVAVIHKEYIVTSCAFIFPIILSAMFNDKGLLNTSFLGAVFILICVGVAFWLDKAVTLTAALNLFVLFGFAFISYLCGVISVNFSAQNYTLIESQAQQNDRLMEDVLRDPMTGLFNQRTFITQLNKALASGEPVCLAMIDVDDFKAVNDTYGHDCGNDVLIFLADTMKKHCTQHTTPYRYGGEEFAIVFQNKSIEDAQEILQAILQEFREHKYGFTDAPITFSAGIVQYTEGLTGNSLFEAADQTLYRAKKEGKNRILKRTAFK